MLQVTTIADELGRSVVSLGRGARRGGGVVVGQDRVAVLARSAASEPFEVRVGGSVARGEVVAVDRAAGIALVNVPTGDAPPVRWADAPPSLGDAVVALGDPGGTGLRVTEGRVSAAPLTIRLRNGRPVDVVEHTAPLPRGTGGGPLLDADGAVVGINALRGDPGFILALSVSVVRPAVERLLEGRPEPARLGVAVAPPRAARRMRRAVGLPDRDGLLVREVEDGSPAERAGVQAGDLLVRLGATELGGVDDLFAALAAAGDEPVTLVVVRGVDEHELTLQLDGSAS